MQTTASTDTLTTDEPHIEARSAETRRFRSVESNNLRTMFLGIIPAAASPTLVASKCNGITGGEETTAAVIPLLKTREYSCRKTNKEGGVPKTSLASFHVHRAALD